MLIFSTIDKKPINIQYSHKHKNFGFTSYISGAKLIKDSYNWKNTDNNSSNVKPYISTRYQHRTDTLEPGIVFTTRNKNPLIYKKFNSRKINYTDTLRPKHLPEEIGLIFDVKRDTINGLHNSYTNSKDKHTPRFVSMQKYSLKDNAKLKSTKKIFRSFVKDYSLTGKTGEIGELDITLEVYRLCEYRFKLPTGYLEGLNNNSVAYAIGDELIVHTKEIGKITLYTDKGTITIKTLPGMRINKARLGDKLS